MTCTQEQFLNDVADHQITVLHDDGLYRHLRFKSPKIYTHWFDLITWPCCLCINGWMGDYVYAFPWSVDVFAPLRLNGDRIDPLYLDRKIQALDLHESILKLDEGLFLQVINEHRMAWVREKSISKEARRKLWDDVEDRVISRIDDGVHYALDAAYSFSHLAEGKEFRFIFLFERTFSQYTHSYLWCCHAIQWGIARYDAQEN